MSLRIMTEVWADPPVGGNLLLLLLALADSADEDRRCCWPSVDTLARKTHMSRRTVFRALDELETRQLIRRQQRHNHSTLYFVLPLPGCQIDTSVSGDTPDPDVSPVTPPDVSPVAPRTVREPSTEEPSDWSADADDEPEADQGALLPLPHGVVSAKRGVRVDALWDAVMFACEVEVKTIPRASRGRYNAAVRDLREVGAEPGEVLRRAAIFRATWPGIRLTPNALAARWAECAEFVPHGPARQMRRTAEVHNLRDRMRELDERDGQ